jgi:hypothetical protein
MEVKHMASIEDIPVETRWEIAAKSASTVPLLYDKYFRKVLKEKYDDIERPIWIESGKEMKNLAEVLDLPRDKAQEISESLGVIGAILYGPEMKKELVDATEDRALGRMTQCSVLNRANEMGLDPKISAQRACMVFMKTAVEALNPAFTYRLNKSMCSGDDYCEMVIEKKR